MTQRLDDLASLVDLQARKYGRETAIPGLRLTRVEAPVLIQSVYRPSFCGVLQGAKVSMLGERAYRYGRGQCLLASVDVPVTARIVEASEEAPYLAFSLEIDPAMVVELVAGSSGEGAEEADFSALNTDDLDEDLIDPLCRLLTLLDHPRDLPVLAPMVRREIVWRLLGGRFGGSLRHVGFGDSHAARIAQTAAWIRDHFREPLRVPELAGLAGMSVASFHRHFKSVTTLSPVQFQKTVRLQEARRMLLEAQDVAAVGYAIGYESPSHFSRDYHRQFGAPPGRDSAAIRANIVKEEV